MATGTETLAQRLERATRACDTVADLARVVFDTVAAQVPFAFGCVATTDPASQLITKAYKSDDLPLGDEEWAAAEYGAPDINLLAEIAERPVPVGVLSVDTDGHPETCSRLRDYMTPQFGFTDEIRLVCRSRNTTWGAFGIYRRAGEPYFTAADGAVLASIGTLIAEQIQRILFQASAPAVSSPVAAVLIVNSDDKITVLTATAEDRITDLGGWDKGALPASVLSVVSRARSAPPSAHSRVPVDDGWLSLHAMCLDGPGSGRSVVVTVDRTPAAAIGQMTLAARGLTAREQDVTQLVLRGASTKDIAAGLHLSPHTVQDHLKAIFAKLEVTSRREMIAQLVASA